MVIREKVLGEGGYRRQDSSNPGSSFLPLVFAEGERARLTHLSLSFVVSGETIESVWVSTLTSIQCERCRAGDNTVEGEAGVGLLTRYPEFCLSSVRRLLRSFGQKAAIRKDSKLPGDGTCLR